MPGIKFKATIDDANVESGWAYIQFPLNVSKKLGTRARVSVKGNVNGFPIRTSAMPTGTGAHHIMFNKAMRAGAKADVGDTVLVEVELDAEERTPKVPAELTRALGASPLAKKTWNAITPRAREEWCEWIASAKQEATRVRRIATAVTRLARGERRVYD